HGCVLLPVVTTCSLLPPGVVGKHVPATGCTVPVTEREGWRCPGAAPASREVAVKAVRLHSYDERPIVEEVPEPTIRGLHDVLVDIGGAGLCRTDLHIVEGQWADRSGVVLPYVLGHENAGWVREVGSAVEHVQPGDTVILHPLATCGFCRACRAGDDVHCD